MNQQQFDTRFNHYWPKYRSVKTITTLRLNGLAVDLFGYNLPTAANIDAVILNLIPRVNNEKADFLVKIRAKLLKKKADDIAFGIEQLPLNLPPLGPPPLEPLGGGGKDDISSETRDKAIPVLAQHIADKIEGIEEIAEYLEKHHMELVDDEGVVKMDVLDHILNMWNPEEIDPDLGDVIADYMDYVEDKKEEEEAPIHAELARHGSRRDEPAYPEPAKPTRPGQAQVDAANEAWGTKKRGGAVAKISMPKKAFVAEHKKLLKVLKSGDPKVLKNEYVSQKAELKKMGSGNLISGLFGPLPPNIEAAVRGRRTSVLAKEALSPKSAKKHRDVLDAEDRKLVDGMLSKGYSIKQLKDNGYSRTRLNALGYNTFDIDRTNPHTEETEVRLKIERPRRNQVAPSPETSPASSPGGFAGAGLFGMLKGSGYSQTHLERLVGGVPLSSKERSKAQRRAELAKERKANPQTGVKYTEPPNLNEETGQYETPEEQKLRVDARPKLEGTREERIYNQQKEQLIKDNPYFYDGSYHSEPQQSGWQKFTSGFAKPYEMIGKEAVNQITDPNSITRSTVLPLASKVFGAVPVVGTALKGAQYANQAAQMFGYGKNGKPKKWLQGVVESMKKGAFTKQAKRAGMSVEVFADEVLAHPDKYSTTTKRRAQFLVNIRPKKLSGKGSKEDKEFKKKMKDMTEDEFRSIFRATDEAPPQMARIFDRPVRATYVRQYGPSPAEEKREAKRRERAGELPMPYRSPTEEEAELIDEEKAAQIGFRNPEEGTYGRFGPTQIEEGRRAMRPERFKSSMGLLSFADRASDIDKVKALVHQDEKKAQTRALARDFRDLAAAGPHALSQKEREEQAAAEWDQYVADMGEPYGGGSKGRKKGGRKLKGGVQDERERDIMEAQNLRIQYVAVLRRMLDEVEVGMDRADYKYTVDEVIDVIGFYKLPNNVLDGMLAIRDGDASEENVAILRDGLGFVIAVLTDPAAAAA